MKTRKHRLDSKMWDTETTSYDVTIYHSGGTTHTVYVSVHDDDGNNEYFDKTFRGDNARNRAYKFIHSLKEKTLYSQR